MCSAFGYLRRITAPIWRILPAIMKQVSEAYRKIRNTIRFLMGNLSDFDCEKDAVAYHDLQEIDQYALHILKELNTKVLKAYDDYEFHTVFHSLHHFCVVDMSAFYLDIIKDRLYVSTKDDPKRKAAQTVLYETLQTLVYLLMPILSFTTEEIWSYIRKEGEPESVQMLESPKISDEYYNKALAEKWAKVIALREDVSKALEEARPR